MAGNVSLFQPEQCGSVVKGRHSHSDSTTPIFTSSIPGGQGLQTGTVEAVSAQHFKLWGERQLFQSMTPGKRAHIRHDLIRGAGQIAQSLQLLRQMDAGKAAAVAEYTGRQGGNGIRQGDGSQICAVVERVGTNVSDAVRQCDGSRPAFVQRFGGDCAAHSHTKYAETDRRLPELRKAALIQMAGSKGGGGNGGDSAAFYSVGYHSRPCQPGPAHQRQRAIRQRGKVCCQGQGIGVGLFVQMAEPCKLCAHVGSIAAPIILVVLLLQESRQRGSGQGRGLFCFRGGGCPAAAQRSGVGYFKLQQFHFTPVLSDRSGAAAALIAGAAADPGWLQSNRC